MSFGEHIQGSTQKACIQSVLRERYSECVSELLSASRQQRAGTESKPDRLKIQAISIIQRINESTRRSCAADRRLSGEFAQEKESAARKSQKQLLSFDR